MAFQPVGSLNHRTFTGLIIAQFLAGFNDQAIHASAMFFALHQQALTKEQAISLMPILFFSPWAIFCTVAGFCADRYSKTYSLIFWKVAEVAIALIAMAGFYLGSVHHLPVGPWLVLSTVFLMGTHAAFFAPAKYGAMPEILQPHILSRGNGVLESTTFLAAILGTVTGGLLSSIFRDNEVWIGVTLLVLSLIGAGASFMIAYLPPANPSRTLSRNPLKIYKPLFDNLRTLMRSKALSLSVLGIAFFVFMVAYMRQTMYMHGECQNPRWNEFKTSLIVATVALGVGLGAPLAGFLSGGKIELGMVPLGCIGMILATIIAAIAIEHEIALSIALVIMGFFSGFYMVPLYTLLQHRAPKTSKGDLVATSNFINVTGAMAASGLFFVLVAGGRLLGVTPQIAPSAQVSGTLEKLQTSHGHVSEMILRADEGTVVYKAKLPFGDDRDFIRQLWEEGHLEDNVIHFDEDLFEMFGSGIRPGDKVTVGTYHLRGVIHYYVRPEGRTQTVYDDERFPRILFFGAALMTVGILALLWLKLPDFFVRMLFWLRSLGKFKVKAVGMQHLPTAGPVLLATNCDSLESSLQLVAVTDRATTVMLFNSAPSNAPLMRNMALRRDLIAVTEADDASAWHTAHAKACAILTRGDMLAVSCNVPAPPARLEEMLRELCRHAAAPLVPVFCGPIEGFKGSIRVVFGAPMAEHSTVAEMRTEIDGLGQWIQHNDDKAGAIEH